MNWLKRLHSDDLGKLLLRLSIGGLMLLHGFHKVRHGVGGLVAMFQGSGLPGLLAYLVYVGEVVAPILLIVGLFTRPAGLLVSITMMVAIGMAHRGDIFVLHEKSGASGIELQLLYLLGGLALFFLGAGKFSLSRGRGNWD